MRGTGKILLTIAAIGVTQLLFAQSKTISFTGSGRLGINSATLDADYHDDLVMGMDTLAGDSTTARREMRGYTIFDLGFIIRPNANTEIKAVTRVESDLDGFWGAGINFRLFQLYAQGVIGDAFKYQVGDIKASLTPYTLYNFNDDLGGRHIPALRLFRDVLEYDQFYQDNTWRQQGINTEFALMMPAVVDEISFRGMISKNRQTDFFFVPDRLFGMASIGVHKGKMFDVHYNYAHLFDVAQTAQFASQNAHNVVHTIDWSTDPSLFKGFAVEGEAGWSNVYYQELQGAPEDTTNSFFDIKLGYHPEGKPWHAYAGWKSVSSGFRSPGAQSKRINYGGSATAFSFMTNQEVLRPIALSDLMFDRNLYNNAFSASLASYHPMYNNVTPYGVATPNRQGLSLGFDYKSDSSLVAEAQLSFDLMTEIQGRGISERRSFNLARFFVDLALDKALDWQRPQHLTISGNWQNTTRAGLSGLGEGIDGIGAVDLSSLYLEAGLQNELFDQFDLMTGIVMFSSSGNEYVPLRDDFNQITDYYEVEADLSEMMAIIGFRYSFTPTSQLILQQQFISREDATTEQTNWKMNQFTILYNMFF